MKTLKSVTAVLIILFCTSISAETAFDKNKMDNYLHVLEKNHKAMGGVVISKNGKIVYKNYTGFSSIENKLRNNDKTKFRAASITKMFTSVMIFQLIEEGRLTLDTKLSEFYPDVPNSNEITIAQLLEHRTGIHDFIADPEFNKFRTSRMTKEKLLKRILKHKSDIKPGEKFKYSNSNFVLLGYIIEDITKSTYSGELKKRITDKLGLKDTAYGGRIDIQNNDAESYRFLNKKWTKQGKTDMNCLHGAGGIVSTPDDLAIFISALFDHKLISEKSINEMKKTGGGFYGRGMLVVPFGRKIIYGHNGEIDGFNSVLRFLPDDNLAVAIQTNGMDYGLDDITKGVLNIYFNQPYTIPDFTDNAIPIKLPPEELQKYEGEFSAQIVYFGITLKIKNNQLHSQATGEPALPLTPFSKTEFRCESAGITIEFQKYSNDEVNYNSFILKQGARKVQFIKK